MGVRQTSSPQQWEDSQREPEGKDKDRVREGSWNSSIFTGWTVGPFGRTCALLQAEGRTPEMIQRPSEEGHHLDFNQPGDFCPRV